jgi:hypothetical protein
MMAWWIPWGLLAMALGVLISQGIIKIIEWMESHDE